MRWLLAVLLASACVEVGRGPDLGPCANPPDGGAFSYGEIGIGTCLAGPVDLLFFEQDGDDWLAVSNADPYRNFETGSVLVLDWDELEAVLDARNPDLPPRLVVGRDVAAVSLPLADDDTGDGRGENAWLGGLGYLEGHQRLVVTSRLTEQAIVRAAERDELFVLDTSGLSAETPRLSQVGDPIVVEDDPYPVVVQDQPDRFFVGNLTDHSLSVLRSGPRPRKVDVVPGNTFSDVAFDDGDRSGSLAEIALLEQAETDDLTQERWTLTYLPGTTALFVPELVDVTGGLPIVGHRQFTSGDLAPFRASGFGLEEGLTGFEDPIFGRDDVGVPTFIAVRSADNAVVLGVAAGGGRWGLNPADPVLTARQGELLASPTLVALSASLGIFHELRQPLVEGDEVLAPGASSIVLATSTDGVNYTRSRTVFAAEDCTAGDSCRSYEDPFVATDGLTLGWRMWMTLRDDNGTPADLTDDRLSVGLAESQDGTAWSDPVEVLAVGNTPIGAPVVARFDQHYRMWAAQWSGAAWDVVESRSLDGRTWSDPVVVVEGDPALAPEGPERPPRAGALVDLTASWRVEGRDLGRVDVPLLAPGQPAISLPGFELAISAGHEVPNDVVPAQRARGGLVPGSVVDFGGETLLFATAEASAGRRRIAVLGDVGGEWQLVTGPFEMERMLTPPGGSLEVFAPVVVAHEGSLVLLYSALDPASGSITTRRATSDDGRSWTLLPEPPVFDEDPSTGFDSGYRQPHSVQTLDDGRLRLWFTAHDGGTDRIGAAVAASPLDTFVRELNGDELVWLDLGSPGSFDDGSVRDPLWVDGPDGGGLYYAGFDGTEWALGHARLSEGQLFRRISVDEPDLSAPALQGQPRSFSVAGARSPVLLRGGDPVELLYAGFGPFGLDADRVDNREDGLVTRIGRAFAWTDAPSTIFPAHRYPTAGDTLTFQTRPAGPGAQVIELETRADDFANPAEGMSSLTLDQGRGFIYVTSKLNDQVLVADIRDDSRPGFDDANHFDVETAITVETRAGAAGFTSSTLIGSRDLLALTMRQPDGIALLDLTELVDNDRKEVTDLTAVTFLPLPSLEDDAGGVTLPNTRVGGAGMALTEGERFLLATHFSANGLAVFDLSLGAWGEEVAWLPNLGEHPHVVEVARGSRYAVVANYTGEFGGDNLTENTVNATLAVIDLHPDDERRPEIAAWIVNQ